MIPEHVELATELINIIGANAIVYHGCKWPITTLDIATIWNIFNMVANVEGIPMIVQINVFEATILNV